MTDKEKNEVIAWWAGFRPYYFGVHGWMAEGIVFEELPDFTDLTTLFKWCVPKLDHIEVATNHFDTGKYYGYACIEHTRKLGYGDTPGEALRDAIVSAIREGDDS